MGCLKFKSGVQLETVGLGGACILAALARTAQGLQFDLEVTSGTDGLHSGPDDPHHHGNAYDVHSKSLSSAAKHTVLTLVLGYLAEFTAEGLGDPRIVDVSDGLATELFFGFLEDPGTENEHFHYQVRKGRQFPQPPGARLA